MNFRLTFIIVLLLIAPTLCTKTAYADAMTTSYEETGLNNREQMRWEFHCDTLEGCTLIPAGRQAAWNSGVGPSFDNTVLGIFSAHIRGPHFFDINPGATVNFDLTFTALNALAINAANPVFTLMGRASRVHQQAFPPDHEDLYALFARRTATGFDFILNSQHIPEPATLLLLGTGLAAVAIKARKRLKARRRD